LTGLALFVMVYVGQKSVLCWRRRHYSYLCSV